MRIEYSFDTNWDENSVLLIAWTCDQGNLNFVVKVTQPKNWFYWIHLYDLLLLLCIYEVIIFILWRRRQTACPEDLNASMRRERDNEIPSNKNAAVPMSPTFASWRGWMLRGTPDRPPIRARMLAVTRRHIDLLVTNCLSSLQERYTDDERVANSFSPWHLHFWRKYQQCVRANLFLLFRAIGKDADEVVEVKDQGCLDIAPDGKATCHTNAGNETTGEAAWNLRFGINANSRLDWTDRCHS